MLFTKSMYINHCKCAKLAWFEATKTEVIKTEGSKKEQEKRDLGIELGYIAQNYFGKKKLWQVSNTADKNEMFRDTALAMENDAEVITEATFLAKDDLYCQVDLLKRNKDNSWDMIEVKSSHIKPYHITDMSFQYYVLSKNIKVRKAIMLSPNTDYRRAAHMSMKKLFNATDVTELVKQEAEKVEEILNEISLIEKPSCCMGKHCQEGWECPYIGNCIDELPEEKKALMTTEGLSFNQRLTSLAEGRLVIPRSKELAFSLRENEIFVNKPKLEEFLRKIRYPLFHLDFEAEMKPIPWLKDAKPWQQIPFQYSLHVEHADGTLDHKECLVGTKGRDPRRIIAEKLVKQIPYGAMVAAYNATFEKGVIKELSELFPEYASHFNSWEFIDLMIPFRSKWVMAGSMKSRYSIKVVLPALCPELSYKTLNVRNGLEAQESYRKLLTTKNKKEHYQLRKDMLAYCGLDTFAMVKVLEALRNLCAGH